MGGTHNRIHVLHMKEIISLNILETGEKDSIRATEQYNVTMYKVALRAFSHIKYSAHLEP